MFKNVSSFKDIYKPGTAFRYFDHVIFMVDEVKKNSLLPAAKNEKLR